jgi:hypothetical protein
MNPEDQQELSTGPVSDGDAVSQKDAAPQIETAQEHSGSDHVSHGANSNLTPDMTQTGADVEAASEIQRQHQREGEV